ncbi:MAG: PKD domain-containing protein, partial [Bacteroidota bacterium]
STETSAGTCPIVITRTYTIEDECGNTSTVDQTLEVDDTQAPNITGTLNLITDNGCVAADATAPVTTVADLEAMGVTIDDNCTTDANLLVSSTETTAGTCPIVITRTYTIEDECGNTSTVDQTLEVEDTQAPNITGTPNLITDEGCTAADATAPVTTVADLEAMGVTIDDNCTLDVDLTVSSTETAAGSCPIVITRTYTIEDECGNTSTVDQTLEVEDTQAPTASNPATTTVQCASDVPATDPTVVTDEADNCTANPTVTFLSETTDNNVCDGEELTRVYEIADDCGNTTTVTHTIIIDAYTPTFTVAGTDPTVCGGTDGFITVSGLDPNTDYDLGYNGNATNPITTDGAGEYVIANLSAGSYTDFEINPASCDLCVETVNTNINLVDPNAPPVDAGPDQTICDGETVTLTADNPNNANISWNNGVTDGDAFAPPVGTNNYTVTAEEAGCTATDQVEVTVHPTPNVDAGNDVFVCDGESVTLSGSGADTYVWDNGVSDGVSFVPTATNTYTVTGTSAEGCTATDDVLVTVYDNPDVDFEADVTEGCTPQEVNFSNLTSGNTSVCEWDIAGTTITDDCSPSYTFANSGCFNVTLTVTTEDGCSDSHTENNYICIDDYPVADFSADPSELTSLYNETTFDNSSVGAETYAWDFDDGESSTATNPSHTFPGEEEDEFLVELIATSQYGCKDTTYETILMREELLYYVPNSFTPDNDKFNEKFKPVFTSGFDPQDYTLLIFNRWGETIFESNHPEVGWDGTYGADSEEIVKDGTYVWKIEFKTKYDDERKVELGHVNVLR